MVGSMVEITCEELMKLNDVVQEVWDLSQFLKVWDRTPRPSFKRR